MESGVPKFWIEFGALSEIDPANALIIGDFGLGSDAPITIDSDTRIVDPKVMRLAWGAHEQKVTNHWIVFFQRLSEFATFLENALRNAAEPGARANARD